MRLDDNQEEDNCYKDNFTTASRCPHCSHARGYVRLAKLRPINEQIQPVGSDGAEENSNC